MTLVLRKLLASSTFAIAGALDSIVIRLKAKLKNTASEVPLADDLADDFETMDEVKDEWEEEPVGAYGDTPLTKEDLASMQTEIADLEAFRDLAVSIREMPRGSR